MAGEPKLTVSHAPFWHDGTSTASRSGHAMLALAPAAVLGVMRFGGRAVGVIGLSVACCMIFEIIMNKLTKKPLSIPDGTAALTGFVIALMLPVSIPWWAVVTLSFCAMVIGKHIWGGLGGNPFNPVLIGMAMASLSWGDIFNFNAAYAHYSLPFSGSDPIAALKHFGSAGAAAYSTWELFLGNQIGGIGSVSGLALVMGGLYLILKGVIRWEISLSFLAGVFLTAWIFAMFGDSALNAGPLFHLVTGYTLIGAFFLATEESSSPVNFVPMIIYGLAAGFMVVLIRSIGRYDDGVIYALLLMNVVHPLLDKLGPKALGRIGEHA